MAIVDTIRDYWGWVGLKPAQVVAENDFGNLLVRDQSGRFWRLCPEDLYCKVVAHTRADLDALIRDPEFESDWCMDRLVEEASARLGPLEAGRKYCLKVPGILGGEYGGDNLGTISLAELIAASGTIAKQIDGLPDGARVRLSVGDAPD
ncbi:MAG: DUF1851 domain-containing protein [Gammaproteobacteria bacterium]|nr:DUF1851 domain-containing protein [Gammaproteobacteria bacterium]